jgi:hypothetical protein
MQGGRNPVPGCRGDPCGCILGGHDGRGTAGAWRLNAAYGPVSITLSFPAEVIGVDGHSPGGGKDARYSRVWTHPADEPIDLSTAQRYDLLLTPDRMAAG